MASVHPMVDYFFCFPHGAFPAKMLQFGKGFWHKDFLFEQQIIFAGGQEKKN